jgi:hypothetical protein
LSDMLSLSELFGFFCAFGDGSGGLTQDFISRLQSGCVQDALSEQVELRASIHLSFDQFQPVNLPFDVSVAPR